MYNILDELPEVIKNVRSKGYDYECPKQVFINELKRVTGNFNDKTLGKWMKNFSDLGYIQLKSPTVIEICNIDGQVQDQ